MFYGVAIYSKIHARLYTKYWKKKTKTKPNALTSWAALAQVFLSALGTVLTQQLVVAHQQLHRGELVEAGLDGALLGAGYVAVGQCLEGPLVVLVQVLYALSSLLLCRIVRRTISGGEAEVDLWHRWHQLLRTAASLYTRRRGRSRRRRRRRSQGGSGRRCGCVPEAERRGSRAALALWSLAVSVVATVLSSWISLAAIWEVACCRHPASWRPSGRSPRCYLFFWPVCAASHSPIFSRAQRPYDLLLLQKKRHF